MVKTRIDAAVKEQIIEEYKAKRRIIWKDRLTHFGSWFILNMAGLIMGISLFAIMGGGAVVLPILFPLFITLTWVTRGLLKE